MPNLVTGTVVLWQHTVVENKKILVLEEVERVTVYVPEDDTTTATVRTAIIQEYIDSKNLDETERGKLWERAGKGSLQVVEVKETPVTPPPVSVTPVRPPPVSVTTPTA